MSGSQEVAAREIALWRLAAYALPALPLAVLSLPLYAVVPNHYATHVGLPIAVVGQMLLLVRLFDAVTDPLVGFLSDRTRSALGRRKVWFLAGAPLTALSAYMLFTPAGKVEAGYLLLWGAALSLGWTLMQVPYNAWGAELSRSYGGRNRVAAAREGLAFVGVLVALIVQATMGEPGAALFVFALIVAIGAPAAGLVAVFLVPDRPPSATGGMTFLEGFAYLRGNKPFVRLIAAFLINGFANGLPATLFLFYVAERLGAPASAAGPLLVLYFACGVAGVPFWLKWSLKVGKHRAWCHAMLMACAAFAVAPFLGPGDIVLFGAVCVVTGLAVGADLVLPASMQADVIDVDTAASGEERSGIYLAFWGLATKLALALAVGIAFPVLAASGFDPQAGLRTPAGLAMLGFLYAGLPVALKLVAVALMWRFPLTAEDQARLRATIAARAQALPVTRATSVK